jgi:hypothetical protein
METMEDMEQEETWRPRRTWSRKRHGDHGGHGAGRRNMGLMERWSLWRSTAPGDERRRSIDASLGGERALSMVSMFPMFPESLHGLDDLHVPSSLHDLHDLHAPTA